MKFIYSIGVKSYKREKIAHNTSKQQQNIFFQKYSVTIFSNTSLNDRCRIAHSLSPALSNFFPARLSHLSLISDHFLSHPHLDLHNAPVHMVAKMLQIFVRKTQARLGPYARPQSSYARYVARRGTHRSSAED